MIAGLLFHGGLRRSEVSALQWRDVTDANTAGALLVAVRRSKTNQDAAADIRLMLMKNGPAAALRQLRASRPADAPDTDRVVPLTGQQIAHRRRQPFTDGPTAAPGAPSGATDARQTRAGRSEG